MSEWTHDQVAQHYDDLVPELEAAIRHARVAAAHYRDKEVPRGCAHGMALLGHLHRVQQALLELADHHADKAQA